ncbi:MAG: hypothetical protein AVDCRST_MAG89-1876, partial [uncultured Gemmatimonadetes bacterium]
MFKHAKGILPLLAALALAACDGGTGSDQARLTIRLTDAPGDLAQAWVKIDRIYLQGAEGDSAGGRVDVLTTRTGFVDLLTLSGGRTAELVNGAVVPAGRYSELRFVVCEAYIVTKNGTVYATKDAELPAGVTATGQLHIPSGCASGIKVKFPSGDDAVELESESAIMTVDFDVTQSFGHQAGNSGKWVMHPVLRATGVGFSGGIAGAVSLAQGVALPTCGGQAVTLQAFTPRAIAGADSLNATVGADARYRITAAPGTYTMAYAPVVAFTNGDSLTVTATPSAP